MSKFPSEFTEEELTEWLNTLDASISIGILEKIYKDMRDCALQKIYEEPPRK